MLIIEHAKKESELGLRPKSTYLKKDFSNKYFEMHHILPRSLYPLWIKDARNIVALTPREHYFCHQLLTKIFDSQEMICALWFMSINNKNNKYNISSRQYESTRIKFYEKNINKGRIHTEQSRKNMSNAHKGIKLSEAAKAKLRAKWKEGVWANREPPSENARHKISETLKEKYQKGEIVTWNKGSKTPEEVKRKISESEKGKVIPDDIKKVIGQHSKRLALAKGALYRYYKNNIEDIKWSDFIKIYKSYFNIDRYNHSIYTVLEELNITL
jgi:hypothetical protein